MIKLISIITIFLNLFFLLIKLNLNLNFYLFI